MSGCAAGVAIAVEDFFSCTGADDGGLAGVGPGVIFGGSIEAAAAAGMTGAVGSVVTGVGAATGVGAGCATVDVALVGAGAG